MLQNNEISEIIEKLGRGSEDYIIVKEDLLRRILAKAPRDILTLFQGQPATTEALPSPDDVLVHRKVRRIREAHGITQGRLAQAAKVRQPDISDFEVNGPVGYAERVPRIVEALRDLIGKQAGA